MAAFDPIHFLPIHKYFPELTLSQVSIAFLRAQGCSVSEIAALRNISESAVKKNLKTVCLKLEIPSIALMVLAIDMRVRIGQMILMESLFQELELPQHLLFSSRWADNIR